MADEPYYRSVGRVYKRCEELEREKDKHQKRVNNYDAARGFITFCLGMWLLVWLAEKCDIDRPL